MSFWDFYRGTASVQLLLQFANERGLAETAVLARSRIDPAQLRDPNCELTALQELRVVENLLRLLGSPPGLGLEVGLRYHFSTFGLWGYGLICSATVDEAVKRALRFVRLTYAYSTIERNVDEEFCTLTFRAADLPVGVSRFLLQRDMAAAAALLVDVGGPEFTLSSFQLQKGRGRAYGLSSVVDSVAGAKPVHHADIDSLAFPIAWLDRPLPNANPGSAAMCDDLCAKLIERRRVQLGTATFIQQYLEVTSLARPRLGRVAGLSSTSERTLRRRLREEGTSFRAVVSTAQAQLALELVRDGSTPISAIAERLGYADLSSFSQAFKRWHGVSPMTLRRSKA